MKLIIWDFDGTLVDSRPLIEMGMAFALERLGLPRSVMDEWLKYVGLPVEEGIRRTFGPLGQEVDKVLQAYRSFSHADHEHLLAPFEGMESLVRELHGAGVPMAVATSKRGLPLRRQLLGLGWEGLFDPLVTPDEVTHGKPHPESLELCLKHHGLAPAEALMVGDTPFDLEMAQRAGVPAVAVGHGFYPREALLEHQPEAYAEDVVGLRAILRDRMNSTGSIARSS